MQKITAQTIIAFVVFALLATGVGLYIYNDFSKVRSISSSPNGSGGSEHKAPTATTSKENAASAGGAENSGVSFGNIEFREVGSTAEVPKPIPDLDRKIVFPEAMDERIRKYTQNEFDRITGGLKEDPTNYENWLDLGSFRKSVNDYEGAEIAWIYATKLLPDVATAYGNLANLYGYELKKHEKAEENFRMAIERAPAMLYLYAQAALFSRDILKDIEKARSFIRWGIENNPDNKDLKTALQELST